MTLYVRAPDSYNPSNAFVPGKLYRFIFEDLDDDGDIHGYVVDSSGVEYDIWPGYLRLDGLEDWELVPDWAERYIKTFRCEPSENVIEALEKK